ncbi:MAG TPA: energy transducer TonB [Candidatus Saccharimonadales bacterium]|nr:energy transducer TonB [Candidatus Saccharimonadales bacterium]
MTEVDLKPGSVSGADDCLGPGQSFSTTTADILPSYMHWDEGPELLHEVEPVYPPELYARGIEDTIVVQTLVCRSGRFLDGFVPASYRSLHPRIQVHHDPAFVEAALAAVRQYVWKAPTVSGQPVAFWIVVTVVFRR